MKKFIFFLFCLMLLGIGVYVQFIQTKNYIETEAVITRIETVHRKGKRSHDVYIQFTVDDQSYEGRSNVYKASFNEGDTVKVYYDPDDPSHFRVDAGILGWVFIAVAAVFVVVSAKLLFGKPKGA